MGPLIAGALSENLGWDSVFYALMIAAGLGLLVCAIMQFPIRMTLIERFHSS